MILINSNTRQFNIPGADLVFGVSGDSDSERKYFQCPRYVGNNLDLMSCFVRINFRNANGKMDFYLVDDLAIDGDNVTFSWLLSPKVTAYKGQVKFVMCAVGPDLKLKWHTTQGTGQVMDGLEPDNSHVESQTADVVAQLIAMVEQQTAAVESVGEQWVADVNAEGATQVQNVKTAASDAQVAAVAEIEAKGVNTRDSIPADYTALSAAVAVVAPGIACEAEGEVITLSDASDQPLRSLRIFGKSTQDGVPSPENPVEIVSIENPTVSVDEQTITIPRAVPGIPVTSGGNYTDSNGQQWICDEVDLERGVYVQRTNVVTLTGDEQFGDYTASSGVVTMRVPHLNTIRVFCSHATYGKGVDWANTESILFRLSGFGVSTFDDFKTLVSEAYNNGSPVVFMCVRPTPIETTLSETEIAAYRELHTNKPNTTILNDSGAYMSVEYTADTKLYIDNKIKEALQ